MFDVSEGGFVFFFFIFLFHSSAPSSYIQILYHESAKKTEREVSSCMYSTYVSQISASGSLPHLQRRDGAPDFFDDAHALMSQRHAGFDIVRVRMAQSRMRDAQEHFVWLQRREVLRDGLDFGVVVAESGVCASWAGHVLDSVLEASLLVRGEYE